MIQLDAIIARPLERFPFTVGDVFELTNTISHDVKELIVYGKKIVYYENREHALYYTYDPNSGEVATASDGNHFIKMKQNRKHVLIENNIWYPVKVEECFADKHSYAKCVEVREDGTQLFNVRSPKGLMHAKILSMKYYAKVSSEAYRNAL